MKNRLLSRNRLPGITNDEERTTRNERNGRSEEEIRLAMRGLKPVSAAPPNNRKRAQRAQRSLTDGLLTIQYPWLPPREAAYFVLRPLFGTSIIKDELHRDLPPIANLCAGRPGFRARGGTVAVRDQRRVLP